MKISPDLREKYSERKTEGQLTFNRTSSTASLDRECIRLSSSAVLLFLLLLRSLIKKTFLRHQSNFVAYGAFHYGIMQLEIIQNNSAKHSFTIMRRLHQIS